MKMKMAYYDANNIKLFLHVMDYIIKYEIDKPNFS
jgi:hypothetical protein